MMVRTLAVLGLSALTVAQPLFSVLTNSPEFFVARNTTLGTALAAVTIICMGVPLALIVPELLLARLSARAAGAWHALIVTVLVTALVLPWLERADLVGATAQLVLAAMIGMAAAAAAARLASARQFLALLAPAVIVVPLTFVFSPAVRNALVPSRAGAAAPSVARRPPFVFIVFDEFPVNSLLDERREIDADRYPNFAAFSRQAYWFRNASGVGDRTVWALPPIVAGRYSTAPNSVPTLRYYPDNLFTLLSGTYDMTVFGRFLQLCPPSVCHYDSAIPDDTVSELAADLAVVWLHIVLPEPYTETLPSIVGDWRGFAAGRARVTGDRVSQIDRFIRTIDARPARLYFLHTLLPHVPFAFVPSGRRYDGPGYQGALRQRSRVFEGARARYADAFYQRHLLQVGFVDRVLGRIFERLHHLGIYDSALIIVTADHGMSFQPGEPLRDVGTTNAADVLLVPLLIKPPGHTNGITVDDNVSVIDIVPTVADVVGAVLPFEVDGRSLLRPLRRARSTKLYVERTRKDATIHEIADWADQARQSLKRKLERFGSHDETGLYTLPGTGGLLGQPVADLPKGNSMDVRIDVLDRRRFNRIDLGRDELPLYIQGRIRGVDPSSLRLAVALNGVVAATTAPYQQQDEWVFATVVPERYLTAGRTSVRVFVIVERDGQFLLSEADGGS